MVKNQQDILRRKMALLRQRQELPTPHQIACLFGNSFRSLSTPACCDWATLGLIFAAPRFLANTPACHPIGVPCDTVIRLGGGRAPYLARAAFAMHLAAPSFLSDRPAHLPVSISISTVVRVSGSNRCDRCHRHRSNWHHRLRNHYGWWCCGWATQVMNLAAPRLLACTPLADSIDCTVVGITSWYGACWTWKWPWNRSWRRSWRGCGWRRRWWWCRRCRWCCRRERRCCTSHSGGHATILHFLIRPQKFPVGHPLATIKEQGRGEQPRKQPPKQQQQK